MLGLALGLREADGDTEGEAEGLILTEGDSEGLIEGEALGDALGLADSE